MKNQKNTPLKILGMMTGTSCDGIDMACIEINSEGWTPLWNNSSPYPQSLRKRVLEFQRPTSTHTSQSWLELDRDLGVWYGQAAQKSIVKQKDRPDVVANHGQTVAHFPHKANLSRKRSKNISPNLGTTLQLGDGTRIATATGLTVVTQFREGDMAAGGQGAPLAPLFHQMLAAQMLTGTPGISIHNMGGISNLSYFGPKRKVLAFDTGPANIWIDSATEQATKGKQKFDKGGRLALLGKADALAVAQVLKHPFFSQHPPKSTGRDQFPFEYLTSKTKSKGPDLIATATAVTIQSVIKAYQRWIIQAGLPLQKIYVCGGGAKNLTLLRGIEAGLPGTQVSTLTSMGLEAQTIEPLAFAVFGYLSLLGNPLGGSWTGSSSFGPPGHIIPGQNWAAVLKKISIES
jgi:anhydro-N-acetylmuramic acid kinase